MTYGAEPDPAVMKLGPDTPRALASLPADRQFLLQSALRKRRRHAGAMLVPAFVFPIQLFLLRKVGLGIAFWLTGWGPGVWWVVGWSLTPGRVRTVNNEIAVKILAETTERHAV